MKATSVAPLCAVTITLKLSVTTHSHLQYRCSIDTNKMTHRAPLPIFAMLHLRRTPELLVLHKLYEFLAVVALLTAIALAATHRVNKGCTLDARLRAHRK
jgi:hypothetical protein